MTHPTDPASAMREAAAQIADKFAADNQAIIERGPQSTATSQTFHEALANYLAAGGAMEAAKVAAAIRALPLPIAQPDPRDERIAALTEAAGDVLAERERQQSVEGWTPEHDDDHMPGHLALAAACYAANSALHRDDNELDKYREAEICRFWPWSRARWKPKGRRRDLVRAGALILAEIERLDRIDAIGGKDE